MNSTHHQNMDGLLLLYQHDSVVKSSYLYPQTIIKAKVSEKLLFPAPYRWDASCGWVDSWQFTKGTFLGNLWSLGFMYIYINIYIYTRVSCGMFAFKTIWFCPSMGKNIVMFFFGGEVSFWTCFDNHVMRVVPRESCWKGIVVNEDGLY